MPKLKIKLPAVREETLWSAYLQTYFKLWPSLSVPQRCAIITAHNPASVVQPRKHNIAAQKRLISDLNKTSTAWVPILAGDKFFQYTEPSLAISTTQKAAVECAKRFGQNAIFWVEQDELQLIPVLLTNKTSQSVDKFSNRLSVSD